MRTPALTLLFLLVWMSGNARAADLPIYIEDGHNGSFYWMVQNLPLTGRFTLVLIDAHSDATEVFDSDAVRRQVMRAASDGRLDELVRMWRAHGVIQCFNWIEPLIPHPISNVCWVPAEKLSAVQIVRMRRDVADAIDAHEQAAARSAGDFSRRYEVIDFAHFARRTFNTDVIASIDLDYFSADTDAEVVGRKLQRVLDRVLRLRNLRAITFAISRPYLASDAQAHRLLYETLRYLTRVVNVDVHYAPFASTGDDRSLRAKSYYQQRLQVPRYDIAAAPACLRTLILQSAGRIRVEDPGAEWSRLLERWRADARVPRIRLDLGGMPSDGFVTAGRPFSIHLENAGAHDVRWTLLSADRKIYNLFGQKDGFAGGASRFVRYVERSLPALAGRSTLTAADLIPCFDRATGWGTLRLYCQVSDGTDVWASNVLCISRRKDDSFLGYLTEIFNLPYVYGSALLHADGRQSADARYGADCAHFIIYGKRRQGGAIPYVNPRGLLRYLRPLDEFGGFRKGVAYGRRGPIALTRAMLDAGVLLHFGKHVAAVFEHGEGVLTERTRVVHQLEDCPRLTTFGEMARRYKRIRVMTFR